MSTNPTRITPEMVEEWKASLPEIYAWWNLIILLIADWERQREEIRQHSEEMVVAHMLRRELETEIEKLTPPEVPGHTLTVSIEAMAPGATHSVCGKGKTVAEAVASLREMLAKNGGQV